VVDYLRNISPEIEMAKRRSVLKQRFKFFYGTSPLLAGSTGVTSELGDIAVRHMCRHAAEEKQKMKLSESQGITDTSQTKSTNKPSLMKEKAEDLLSFLKTTASSVQQK